MGSYEYSQSDIYYKNKKYEKAAKLLTKLSDMLKITQSGSPAHILTLKRLYANLIPLGKIKDGELILLNIVELMNSEFAKSHGYYIGEDLNKEKLGAKVDVLVHYLAHNQMESNPMRLVEGARALLKDEHFRKLTGTQKAFYHMIIGLCWFVSEKVPYEEVKT